MSTPYTENERRAAWGLLYERFGELPVPAERVWEIAAELARSEVTAEKYRVRLENYLTGRK